MRPPGEIRLMTLDVLGQFVAQRRRSAAAGAHWREVADRLRAVGVAPRATRDTLKNLARAGAIEPAGEARLPGVPRPLTLWAPAGSQGGAAAASPLRALECLTRSWVAAGGG